MNLANIVTELKKERSRIEKAIAALDGLGGQTAAKTSTVKSAARSAKRRRHHLTPQGRKRLSEMMKKRWAERRKKASGKAS
jgi:hypothetical protein